MRLHPSLLLTMLLLGACEKKDSAPGSSPPGIANTKSSHRLAKDESRAARRERSTSENSLKDIESLIRKLNAGNLNEDEQTELRWEAHVALLAMDPADFDAIWKILSGLEDRECRIDFQLTAIYHLAARNDLATAARLTKELLFPGTPEDERASLLGDLFFKSDPTLPEAIDFLRTIESTEDRREIARRFPRLDGTHERLMFLKDANYRLNGEESGVLMVSLAFGGSEGWLGVKDVQDLMRTIATLETDGVFSPGSHERFLLEVGKSLPFTFVKLFPPGVMERQLDREGYDAVIESIITTEASPDPFARKSYPETFFTPEGITGNLPPGKIPVAMDAWHGNMPDDAEAWFTANGGNLLSSQQDQIRATFARNSWNTDKPAAQAWLDQITDPALREKITDEQQRAEEAKQERDVFAPP